MTDLAVRELERACAQAPEDEIAQDRLALTRQRSGGVSLNGIELVYVPSGDYVLGADDGDADEKPRRVERLVQGFWIGRYMVTREQYLAFCQATSVDEPTPGPAQVGQSVVNVSWHDANAFCAWVGGQLPTEWQWEMAARGQDGRTYPWGNGWLEESDQRESSSHGAEQMCGHVWQWTASHYRRGSAARGLRGGSWFRGPQVCRSAYRYSDVPGDRGDYYGFRVSALRAAPGLTYGNQRVRP